MPASNTAKLEREADGTEMPATDELKVGRGRTRPKSNPSDAPTADTIQGLDPAAAAEASNAAAIETAAEAMPFIGDAVEGTAAEGQQVLAQSLEAADQLGEAGREFMAQPALATSEAAQNLADEFAPGWPLVATLPHRLLVAWLEAEVRLIETTFALAELRLQEMERSARAAIELCGQLAEATDPAERVRLQVEHAGAQLDRLFAGVQARYDLVTRQQMEAIEILGRRAGDAMAEVRATGYAEAA